MPDYPPIDGLKQAVIQKITNQPAGDAAPATLRAMAMLSKVYPADTVGMRVKDNPVTDKYAYSSKLAETPIDMKNDPGLSPFQAGDPSTVEMNPAVSQVFPQPAIEALLAHELQHIRQNRSDASPYSRVAQFSQDYEKRPDEIAGFNAADAYKQKMGINTAPTQDQMSATDWLGQLYIPSDQWQRYR